MDVKRGEIFGLIGRSGSGKSTLLRCINGLETYTGGSLMVNGTEVNSLGKKEKRAFQKNVSMIFQHFPLMSRKSVYENIAFPMRCWNYSNQEIKKRVYELAEIVEITEKLEDKPRTLSGGQKQRVSIARALTMNPEILLSDEATSALDPSITHSILKLLTEINRQLGITMIIVAHQISVINSICDSMALLQNGHLMISGPVKEILVRQPEALRDFLGEEEAISPANGTIRIIVMDKDSKEILSQISNSLKISFQVVDAKFDKYQNETQGYVTLRFDENRLPDVKGFLNQKQVFWHDFVNNEKGN